MSESKQATDVTPEMVAYLKAITHSSFSDAQCRQALSAAHGNPADALKRLEAPTPYPRAIIYLAVDFIDQPDGSKEFSSHYVAATSTHEAMVLLREDGIESAQLFLGNVDAHSGGSPVRTRHNGRLHDPEEYRMSSEKFKHWSATAEIEHYEDGLRMPASWLRVPSKADIARFSANGTVPF